MSNNGTELAKAYIPIIPSMDGMQGRLEDLLGDEAENAGSSAGRRLGDSLIDKVKRLAAAAGIGKVIGDSFLEGADLEQSLGGVETLFKQSADTVIKNADNAYRTAGMSANEYMETVTGFSASLLKSLDGDTEEAAARADIALTDMSDNVNKFGGDISNLINAYQGFSRENFTMLDNLRLGYAGNKEGMQQLLKDAEALSGVHYDISSYSDMIDAIHVIQQNLDITGTTAKEAAGTFSGSFASMKASAKNLLGDLTTGRDTQEAVDALADSTGNFADNVVRMSKNMLEGIGELDDALAGTLSKELNVDKDVIEGLIKTVEVGAAAFVAYKSAMSMKDTVSGVVSSIKSVTDAAKESGSVLKALNVDPFSLVTAGAAAAAIALKSFIDAQTDAINEITDRYEGLDAEQKKLLDNAGELLAALSESKNERKKSIQELEAEAETAKTLSDRLYELNSVEKLSAADKAEIAAIVASLNELYPELSLKIDEETGRITKQSYELNRQLALMQKKNELENAGSNSTAIETEYSEALNLSTEAQKKYNEALEVRDETQAKLKEETAELAELTEKANAGYATEDMLDRIAALQADIPELTESLKDQNNAVGETSAVYVRAQDTARGLKEELESLRELYGDDAPTDNETKNLEKLSEHYQVAQQAAGKFKDYVYTVDEETYNISETTHQKIQGLIEDYQSLVDSQSETILSSMDLYSQVKRDSELTFADMDTALGSNQQALADWSEGIETLRQRGVSSHLLEDLESDGVASLDKVQALLTASESDLARYSEAWDTTYEDIHEIAKNQLSDVYDDTAQQIESLIRQPGDYSDDMRASYQLLGSLCAEGYAQGIQDGTVEVSRVTAEMVNKAVLEAKVAAGIASPSKVFRELGDFTGQGYALGIEDSTDAVVEAASDMVNAAAREADTPAITAEYGSPASGEQTASDRAGASENGPVYRDVYLVLQNGTALAKAISAPLDEINGANVVSQRRGHAQ